MNVNNHKKIITREVSINKKHWIGGAVPDIRRAWAVTDSSEMWRRGSVCVDAFTWRSRWTSIRRWWRWRWRVCTVTRVHGYLRGLATAAVRLRYSTATRPALATHSSVSGTKVPAADQTTRYAVRNDASRNSRLVWTTWHWPDGQSTMMTLWRKNSGSETKAATTKMTTLADKLCRTYIHRHLQWNSHRMRSQGGAEGAIASPRCQKYIFKQKFAPNLFIFVFQEPCSGGLRRTGVNSFRVRSNPPPREMPHPWQIPG